jgi:UDP-glucose 4-epimerase
MAWLVTGANGYVGSHTCAQLGEVEREFVALDYAFDPARIVEGTLVNLDIRDSKKLKNFDISSVSGGVNGILHLAALKSVADSLIEPDNYYETNVIGTRNLLEFAAMNGVKNFVFASSAAVYGDIKSHNSIQTNCQTSPSNPYGQSKLEAERLIKKWTDDFNSRAIALRYFNIAGNHSDIAPEVSPTNVFPILIDSFLLKRDFSIFGTDHPTPDGTCIRDYVSIHDVADANLKSINKLESLDGKFFQIMNVGSGVGTSVLDLVEKLNTAEGLRPYIRYLQSRDGDPSYVVSDIHETIRDLGWSPEKSNVMEMLRETIVAREKSSRIF